MSKPSLRPQNIQSRLTHLISHWPADPVRPASVSMNTYLRARLADVSEDQQKPTDASKSSSPSKTQATSQPPAEPLSASSLNALSSLLEDRYARRYPLSPRLRNPPSNPDYYDNLIKEFEEAPSRDFWGRLRKRVTGLFRMA